MYNYRRVTDWPGSACMVSWSFHVMSGHFAILVRVRRMAIQPHLMPREQFQWTSLIAALVVGWVGQKLIGFRKAIPVQHWTHTCTLWRCNALSASVPRWSDMTCGYPQLLPLINLLPLSGLRFFMDLPTCVKWPRLVQMCTDIITVSLCFSAHVALIIHSYSKP